MDTGSIKAIVLLFGIGTVASDLTALPGGTGRTRPVFPTALRSHGSRTLLGACPRMTPSEPTTALGAGLTTPPIPTTEGLRVASGDRGLIPARRDSSNPPLTRRDAGREALSSPLADTGLALAQAPANAKAAAPAPPEAAKVPFEMLPTNHMLVKATINGKGPYHLIFDLGAPITLLGNKAAETSGVIDNKTPRSFLFSMRGEAEIASLETGELKATKLPAIVFDHPALGVLGRALRRQIDGIIGFTLFARYKTTIDYQAREMTFRPVDFTMRDLLKDLPDRLMGPKTAKKRVLAPAGLWGLRLGPAPSGVDASGIPIFDVIPDSPAAKAGLKAGDVLAALDGRWTASIADVYAAASGVTPGQKAEVVILRDGKEQTLTLEPADGA